MTKKKAQKKTVKSQSEPENVFDFDKFNFTIKPKFKLTKKQIEVLKTAQNPSTKMIILDGLPGTSKTFLATLIALEQLRDKQVRGITALRTTIQSKDGDTGFLPGSWEEKGAFLGNPFIQKMNELISNKDRDIIQRHMFDFLPSSFIRSYSLMDECLILSEAQNAFFETIFLCATRAAEGSFCVIEGDTIMQNDIGNRTGFKKFCDMFNDEESRSRGIYYFKFDETDIVRSDLVQYLVEKRMRINS